MKPLNDYVNEYTKELQKGIIQKAYKGIISFMSNLKKSLETKHPEHKTSAIYFGIWI